MSQHDFVVDNAPGLAVRTDIVAALQALASTSTGPVAPATPYAGQIWLNTSAGGNGVLNIRNQANTGWVGLSILAASITGLPTPTTDSSAATKKYVDDTIANQLAQGDDNIFINRTSPTITLQREASDQYNQIIGKDEGAKTMWNLVLGYSTSKNFRLNRYDVNAAFVDTPFYIDWALGKAYFDNGIIVPTGGIVITSGGLTLDNIAQRQSSSTQNLYHSWLNSSGYTEWNWRLANDSKQIELRAYDGLASGALAGVSLSARSSDGKLYFPAGIYGRVDIDVSNEALTLASVGAGDNVYMGFYQTTTQRGYFGYIQGQGIRMYNNASADYLLLSNVNSIDSLQFVIGGTAYPIYHHGNLVYTGSSVSNVTFPVGTCLYCYYNNQALARNASATVRLSSDSFRFELQGSGAVLAGTWRARGQHSDSIVMQRTA